MNRFLRPSERQLRHEFESVKGESCISNESSREWIGHGIDADDLEQVKVYVFGSCLLIYTEYR